MNNLHNFTEQTMFEYTSIFPNVSSLLNQVFFVIGNGFDVDSDGMIVNDKYVPIHKYPALSMQGWQDLTDRCYAKEMRFNQNYREAVARQAEMGIDRGPIDFEESLKEECSKYQRTKITDEMFTEEYLYNEIRSGLDVENLNYPRPYPIYDHSDVTQLTEKTETWLLQIALNFCNAWIRFLTESVDNKYYDPKDPYCNLESTTRDLTNIAEVSVKLQTFIDQKVTQ